MNVKRRLLMSISIFEIILIAIALGVDAFTIALSIGVYSCLPAQVLRLSASFGFFQFIMPVIGWYGGKLLSKIFNFSNWIAFVLLFAIGAHMLLEALKKESNEEKIKCDRTTGLILLTLSVATSIDALGVGVGLGAVNAKLWTAAVIIGIVAAFMTMSGMFIGKRLSLSFGKKMEFAAAAVIILLSFRMLAG